MARRIKIRWIQGAWLKTLDLRQGARPPASGSVPYPACPDRTEMTVLELGA
jgi:hypothetical protein